MRRKRTTAHEKRYTQSGEIEDEDVHQHTVSQRVFETVLRCLDEPLHVASLAKAKRESTKRILKQNRHPLGAGHIEVKEELNAQQRSG